MYYLTNLTYLGLINVPARLNIAALPLLQTLIIRTAAVLFTNFPLIRFDNLSHLEITGYCFGNGEINFQLLKNLTHLDLGASCIVNYHELSELKALKKLILRSCRYDPDVDISGLPSLISLEILEGRLRSFASGSKSLLTLTVEIYDAELDDNSLKAFPNLKHFSFVPMKGLSGDCFRYLDNLYCVTELHHKKLDKECIAELENRGIIVRHVKFI